MKLELVVRLTALSTVQVLFAVSSSDISLVARTHKLKNKIDWLSQRRASTVYKKLVFSRRCVCLSLLQVQTTQSTYEVESGLSVISVRSSYYPPRLSANSPRVICAS